MSAAHKYNRDESYRREDDIVPLRVLDPITWHDLPIPPRRWLVPEWIPWQAVTGLYGDGGLGKSLLAMQLLTAAALGKPWLGLPVQRIKVIGFLCEDPIDELHRRQADINQLYDCDFADLENIRLLPRFGEDNLLMTFDGTEGLLTALFDQLLDEALEFGAQLIVTDTVADVFGGNENDRNHVRQFVQSCLGRLARDIDGAVFAPAHPSRAGLNATTGDGTSGSTGWNNAFRSRLHLHVPAKDCEPDLDARILTRRKANYAKREDELELRWRNGVFTAKRPPEGIVGSIERSTAKRVFLELLQKIGAEGRHVSDNNHAGNYAPKIFGQRPDREGFAKADFERAMQALFAEKQIHVGTYTMTGTHTTAFFPDQHPVVERRYVKHT